MMEVYNVIIHKLEKERTKKSVVVKREKVLDIKDTTENFIERMRKIYNKKQSKDYGIFDQNSISYPFQKMLRQYLKNETDFVTFTHAAMDHFQSVIDPVTLATGGYVVFSHFKTNFERFSVVVLSDKLEYAIDDSTLDIKENINLDLDKLDVANFVNITQWNDGNDTYLSFARGRKDISNYFLTFIGCTDHKPSKETSENFKRAIEDYLDSERIKEEEKADKRQQVYDYCIDCIKNGKEIKLQDVSRILDEDKPDKFFEFASQDEYSISSSFEGHKATLDKIYRVKFKSKDLDITFPKKLLQRTIFYDERENYLKITNIPDKLKEQLIK